MTETMKRAKYALAFVVAAILALAMAVPAWAADDGSITIKPPTGVDSAAKNTYKVYKVFDATVNASDNTKVSYKLCAGDTLSDAMKTAGFSVDAAGNVSGPATLNDDAIAAIASYVTESDLVTTVESTGSANAVASGLAHGYYYITTSTGTVVTIDSTNNNPTVEDKNIVPGINKTITDASSLDENGKKALAQVGSEVEYKVEITVGKGQTNYLFKDTLGTGLEYVTDSLKVTDMTAGRDYTLTVNGQNIQVAFENNSIKGLAQGSKITVTYKAKVTSAALSTDPAKNTATISYGNDSSYTSTPSVVEVYNAKFSVTKEDGDKKPLAGAGFVIKNADGKYYKLEDNVVSWVDSESAATEYTSNSTGAVTAFTGLADGTYTLVEKTVPAGYNKAADSTFTIAAKDFTPKNLEQTSTVTNNAGTELPSTGGMGTTILYIVGGIMVVIAAVVLITKRRIRD